MTRRWAFRPWGGSTFREAALHRMNPLPPPAPATPCPRHHDGMSRSPSPSSAGQPTPPPGQSHHRRLRAVPSPPPPVQLMAWPEVGRPWGKRWPLLVGPEVESSYPHGQLEPYPASHGISGRTIWTTFVVVGEGL